MKTIWKNLTGFWIISLLSLLVTCTACSDENVSDKEKTGNTEHPEVVEASPKYYISSSLGSDSNDGLSEDKPWKTLNRINSGEFNPGDSILLRCGDTWEETVTFNSIFQGSEDAPIVISSYKLLKQ